MTLNLEGIRTLPYKPERSSYNYARRSHVITVELEGGLSKARKDIIGGSSFVSCTWFLKPDEFEYFTAFYNAIAGDASKSFTASLILDKPYPQEFVCKFVPDSLESSSPTALLYNVSAELEVTPIIDEAMNFMYFVHLFDSEGANSLFDAIATTVNTDFDVFGA